jgi:Ca2+-binding RTX toxin-like protein
LTATDTNGAAANDNFIVTINSPLPPVGPPPPPGVNPDAMSPKVLLYVFNPTMENYGGLRQNEVYGWGDPEALTQAAIGDLKKSSHGLVNYQVVDTQIVDQHPYFEDGFQYSDVSFDEAWRDPNLDEFTKFHKVSTFDYDRFATENNIVARVESGEIDEVWIYTGPISGTWESTMAGNGAYFVNSPPQTDIITDRAFIIMGLNFERGIAEAIHSFGHRAENNLDRVYGFQERNLNNNWNRFTFQDRYQAGQGGVGNIHFPVNGVSDYDYANPRFVLSNADEWYKYAQPNFNPDSSSVKRLINFTEWSPSNTDPQREYLNWWYDHLPHFSGKGSDHYLNNWWRYIVDVNQFKGGNGNLQFTTGIPTVEIGSITESDGSIRIVANASADGALGRVDFYVDGQYKETDALGPYTFTYALSGLSGTRTVFAKAYELQNGAEDISDSVTFSTISARLSSTSNRLFLSGNNSINGTGNASNNFITGNSAANSLTGNEGDDLLDGGAGNDRLKGNSGNDILLGGEGKDNLDGGLGDDLMLGGVGNDTYYVDSLGDQTVEDQDAGTDTVRSTLSWALGENLENLILLGTDAINGTGNTLNNTITGNSAANILIGDEGNDTLKGLGGNDQLDGGEGNDKLDGGLSDDLMVGGVGNDTYYVDSLGDQTVEEADAGTDTVRSTLSWALGENLENLILLGSEAINGTGNGLNNVITGNSADNILIGGDGNDTLNGGLGDDILIGGPGSNRLTGGADNDRFVFTSFDAQADTITDFSVIDDLVVLTDLFAGLGYTGTDPIAAGWMRLVQAGSNTRVQIDLDGPGGTANFATLSTLNNVLPTVLTADNFVV